VVRRRGMFLFFQSLSVAMEYLISAVQVVFYGLALNSSRLLSSPLLARAGFGVEISQSELNTSLGIYKWLRNVAVGSLVVSVVGLLPGYYATIFLIDRWGRKQLQFLGFSMLAILLAILGKAFIHLIESDS
jgi:MFS transporter, PHS family, inorganic phosphate transporter